MERKLSIRKNDQVKVIAGKDRGKVGKVLRLVPDKGRAIVEGVNYRKKHTRANPQKGVQAGVTQQETPIEISNLMVVCPECGKQTRSRRHLLEDGSKQRVCVKCGGTLDR